MNLAPDTEHNAPKQEDPMESEKLTPSASGPFIPPHPTHTPEAPTPPPHQPANAGLVVLQWLTYAFWGWTVFGLSILTSAILASFINDADVGGFTPYGIAAVLVLLPISYLCDFFYSKREPAHKTGPETLVMVIHAVLFALFGIGSLVFAVFSLVQLLTAATGTDYAVTMLLSSLIIAVYYGLTFLRTLNPVKFSWITRFYKIFMLISVGIIIILGIVGPVAKEHALRDDRLIEAELTNVQQSIQTYARDKKKLPEDLHALSVNGDTKKLVERSLVTYKPNTAKPTSAPAGDIPVDLPHPPTAAPTMYDQEIEPDTIREGTPEINKVTIYYYELCVTYKKATNTSGYDSYKNPYTGEDDYTNYLEVYTHPAGNTCYKLKTENY